MNFLEAALCGFFIIGDAMPFNGSGIFSLVSGNPVVTGTVISSTVQNNTMSDVAVALTDCVTKDGQSTPTNNIPMGTFRITGLGDAVNLQDAVTAKQLINGITSLTTVAGTDTITATAVPTITTYAVGQEFNFISAGTNTTNTVTLNINGLGAKAITKFGTNTLSPADIVTGQIVKVRYDGTQFQAVMPVMGAISGRNRIINGNCNIAQRGSLVCTSGVSGYGGPDRFFAINTASAGGSFTQSVSTMSVNGRAQPCVVQTVNTSISSMTGVNYWEGIQQIIEGVNAFDLLGKPVVVSFWFQTTVTGTYSFALVDGASTNSYVSTFSATANTPTKVVIPIATLSTSLSITNTNGPGLIVIIGALNTGTFSTASLNSWQSGNHFTSTTLTNWGIAGNTIAVTELQLEAGSVATPFEERSYGQEIALCYRYYWQHALLSSNPIGVGQAQTTTTAYIPVQLLVTMRAAPTMSSPGGMFRLGGEQVSAPTFVAISGQAVLFSVTFSVTAFVAGNAVVLTAGTSPTLSALIANAEL
jgi:hypothetical protein